MMPTAFNPIALPEDLWHEIFSYSATDEEPVRFCQLVLPEHGTVCKAWHQYIKTHPSLWNIAATALGGVPEGMTAINFVRLFTANTPQQIADRIQHCVKTIPWGTQGVFHFNLQGSNVPCLTVTLCGHAPETRQPPDRTIVDRVHTFAYTELPQASDTMAAFPHKPQLRDRDITTTSGNVNPRRVGTPHYIFTYDERFPNLGPLVLIKTQWTAEFTNPWKKICDTLDNQIIYFCQQQVDTTWQQEVNTIDAEYAAAVPSNLSKPTHK